MSTKSKILISAGALVAVLLIIYMGVSVYFMNHFYTGTTINGVDVSGQTVEEAEVMLQSLMNSYELKISGRGDIEDSVLGSDIGITVEWDNQIDDFMESQNGFSWILKYQKADSYETPIEVSYDEGKLEKVIEGLACLEEKNQIAPKNAMISEYDPEKGYQVLPAEQGSTIDKSILAEGVKEGITNLKTELDLESLLCYLKPEVEDETQFQAAVDELNKMLSTVITYQIGSDVHVLDKSVIHTWISLNDAMEVCIAEEEIDEYVKSMASKYNTCYTAKKLMTSYGQEVTISKSFYGWKVDNDAEKAAILEEIKNGTVVSRDLNYSMTANSHEGNDYGNSYVEINLTAQHLFLYVDGVLVVESDFVSGDLATGCDTPTGAFKLTYKKKDATLNGADYSTPVNYWMPFYGNYGMHDATWRSSFGASIYKRDGSHGCVNLPKKAAKEIFEYIDKGFPVLCYTLPGTESEKGIAQDEAYVVMDAIDAIGTVTPESEAAILDAREQYDALSDMAKKYVKNYKSLVAAEEVLKSLKTDVENMI